MDGTDDFSRVVADEDDGHVLSYRSHFHQIKEDENVYSMCQIEGCPKKKLAGKQKFNLERHLRTVHKMTQFTILKELPNAEVVLKIKMDPATVRRAWVESVALDGRIIGCLNDTGTKRLLDPLVQAFEKAGVKVDVSIPTLKDYLTKCAEKVKSEIQKEVEGTIVHVKLDMARHQRKSILGVNIQYMKDDQIKVRTLSMVQTNSSHTGEYICSVLMEILDEFNIKTSQVHTITTDNGSNVVKSAEIFRTVENADLLDQSVDDTDLRQLFDDELDTASGTHHQSETDAGTGEPTDDFNVETMLNDAVSLLEAKSDIFTAIRCAVHTLQLVVTVALKSTDYAKKLINKCRRIVRNLLAPNVVNMIRQQNLRMPLIDCLTRWSSTFYMLERLVELKGFYQNMKSLLPKNCQMNDVDWQALDGIISVLKLFEVLTKKLQSVEFTVSEFYAEWINLRCEMESLQGIELVDNILAEMQIREGSLLQNDVVYSCVYLDPRFQVLLDSGN